MKKIFIVEDDHDIRELIEYLLMSREYMVESFPTAEEFKIGINSNNPDLILMDIMLPDGNGLEMCRDLFNNTEKNHIPVVLMSAHTNIDISKEACVRDFIAKPFDIDDFFTQVQHQLS